MSNITQTAENTEKIIEKLRLGQIILGALFGFLLPFVPVTVDYIDKKVVNPPPREIKCSGSLSISEPEGGFVVYGKSVLIRGTVDPVGPCKHLYLVVKSMATGDYFVTDQVTINPDGTWLAEAKLYFIPQGFSARVQAYLCGNPIYPSEGCLSIAPDPSLGVPSNSVLIERRAVPEEQKILPSDTTELADSMTAGGGKSKPIIQILEWTSVAAGRVSNITHPENYKIVIYALDKKYGWVKQPYPGNRPNEGYATIREDGSWSIVIRKRSDDIDSYIVLLVPKREPIADRLGSLKEIEYIAKEEVR